MNDHRLLMVLGQFPHVELHRLYPSFKDNYVILFIVLMLPRVQSQV